MSVGDGWRFGHKVEVEELDKFEFDFARCGARFEERCHCEETVEAFKGSSVSGCVDEGDNEGEEGSGLNSRAVDWFKEVEEELCVVSD